MEVVDDGFDLPGEGGIRAALAVVVAGLDQMPEVVDHAGGGEERARQGRWRCPRGSGPFAEEFEVPVARIDAEDGAGEVEGLAVVLDVRLIEDAVPAVEPAVGAPGEGVGQLVGVVAAEAGDDDLGGAVGDEVAVEVAGRRGCRASWRPRRRRGRRRCPRGCSGPRRRWSCGRRGRRRRCLRGP